MLGTYRLACIAPLFGVLICAVASAQSEGQADLDKAVELQLSADSLEDLEKVIDLCESALKKGIDKDNEAFAKQILSSVLYERANQVTQAIVEGRVPPRRLGEFRDRALSDLEKSVTHNPMFGDAYVLSAKLQGLPGGDREAGIKAATEAIRCYADDKPKRAEALVLRGQLQPTPEKQLADFEEATQHDPQNVNAWQARAIVYLSQDNFDKAIESFQKILEIDGENPLALNALAEALIGAKKYDEAMKQIEKAIQVRPEAGVSYLLRARLHLLKENSKEALADLDKALELEPRDVNALMLRARVHQVEGDNAKAKADVNRVLRLRPGADPAILLRSLISAGEGKFIEAINDVEGLLKKDPKNIEWRLQLGTLYVADGRPRKGIELFTAALEDDKGEWRVLRARADALLSIGKHKEAIADYEAALKIESEDDGILNNYAWVLATSPMDDVRDAKKSLELAIKACEVTKYEKPHILSTLAAAHAENGDFEAAKKWSQAAIDKAAADKGELQEQLKKELESYQANKAWREIQNVEEKADPVSDSEDALDT